MIKIKGAFYLYLGEAAEKLNMSSNNLRINYIKTGKIKARKMGKRWIIPEKSITEYLNTPSNKEI